MPERDLWTTERAFWTEGEQYFRSALAADCVMLFPSPVGILAGAEAVLSTLRHAPRWADVQFHNIRERQAGDAVTVLAYTASASRTGAPPYYAHCSSVYRTTPRGHELLHHQQTPAAD